jgi:hypothetical protein
MAVDSDVEDLALHAPVEAFNETIGLRRVGLGLAVLHPFCGRRYSRVFS